VTTELRTFNDSERIANATTDGGTAIGPLESSGCSHGQVYQFRYQWPKGSGGPDYGEVLVLTNPCIDCALQGWLRPGSTRKL